MATKEEENISGYLLTIAQKKKHVVVRHKLDTNTDLYYKTLHDSVIPECMELVKEVPGFPQRMKECITHTTPSCCLGWSFGVELVYRKVADECHQTEENMKKMRMLRVLLDMCFGMGGIIDDYVDKGKYRYGKKTWASICEGGQEAAIYDTYTVNYLITCILQHHFRNDPGYNRMLDIFSYVNGRLAIGQTLDILNKSNHCEDRWKCTVKNKGMNTISAIAGLGLAHAGIICDDLINKTMNIFGYYGLMFQLWDDFMEFYSVQEESGKEASDCQNNVPTWATVTALAHFNESQTKEFKACYGSSDPVKRSRVRELFDEIDLTGKYLQEMRNIRITVEKEISKLQDARVREACTSYLEWLLGEAPHAVELDGLKA